MSNDLNLCQFIGRLGRDPETRTTQTGTTVTNINLACSWKSKDQEGTEWVRVVAFGKLAEIMGQYLKKGDQVYIGGNLRTRKWQDQSGQDRYTTEVVAQSMQMLGGPKEQQTARPPADQGSDMDEFDSDIPF